MNHCPPSLRQRANIILCGLLVFSGLHMTGYCGPVQQIPVTPPEASLPDAADLVPWPVKSYPVFAPDSAVNAAIWTLDAPAGKHGVVQIQPDGQLAFADKTPARFWGTTLVYGMTFPEKPEEIAQLADAIAADGYNLVRFHHNDMPREGLGYLQQKPASNYLLDPKMIDRLDHLAAELYKRGIYVYLDFADSRDLLEEDGLPDWQNLAKLNGGGWKALFPHPKIVEAWKRAVSEFLKHRNPYTGRVWGQDPGVVTVEIINENGLFWDWNFKLNETMRQWHDEQWNKWLLAKYGNVDNLNKQWTDVDGVKGLFDGEDPAKNNVFAPRLGSFLDWDRPYHSKTRGAARVNDYYAYLADTATNFYREASQHIRSLGFKGVIVGSHELQGPINQYAEVQGTGAIAGHLYARGLPTWNARPTTRGAVMEGVDVKTNNWYSNIPRIKVRGVPGINGEWTGGTLTQRADVNLAVAAITAFQKTTQSLHFAFGQRWTRVPLSNFDITYTYHAYEGKVGHSYSSIHDEPWMAVNRICAALFDRRDFAKSRASVDIAFSTEDRLEQNLHALGLSGGSGTIGDAATFLPLLHNVECAFFDKAYAGDADVVFMTGRTASGDYRKAKHAVLVGDNPYADHYHKQRDLGVPARFIHPDVKIVNLDTPATFTVAWPYDAEKTLSFDSYQGAIELASIPAGAQPIGKSADGKYTLGWLDDRFLVLPNGRAFQARAGDIQWLYRMYLAAAKRWKIDVADNSADAAFYRSDTRELTVDWGYGTLAIDTPRTQGFSGLVGWRPENATRNLTCKVNAPYANVLVTSIDGKPVQESRRMLLVATGRMENTNQELGKDKGGFLAFTNLGKAPALVEALRGEVGLSSGIASRLAVYALDCEGRRLGKVTASVQGDRLTFPLSPKWGTIWFEIAALDVPGPTAAGAQWPLEEKPRVSALQPPALVSLQEFFENANGKTAEKAPVAQVSAENTLRFTGKKFSDDKTCRLYGNAAIAMLHDEAKGEVLRAQFGKINQQWNGGVWSEIASPATVKPGDCLGVGLVFKGDGTSPKKAFLDLRTTTGASYRSKNINTIFENDAWQEVVFKPEDFQLDPAFAEQHPDVPKIPDWATVNRFDLSCNGPLMDQESVGQISEFYFLLKREAGNETPAANVLRARLSTPGIPSSSSIIIPYFPDVVLQQDGQFHEAEWQKAFGMAMDEKKVPAWHYFGSHVVEGKQSNGEGANFWMFATKTGLALGVEVHKGSPNIVAEKADWYLNDCVEVFTDPENKGGKPAKQLFLAFRRANLDSAAASDSSVQIGRAKLQDGYMLEAMIPWKALAFPDVPAGEFGLEFQLDFAQQGLGKTLQMTYGTGTNEAWIKSDHFLKVKIAR